MRGRENPVLPLGKKTEILGRNKLGGKTGNMKNYMDFHVFKLDRLFVH
jgi:hypothetical protein